MPSKPRPRTVTICDCADHAFSNTSRWGVAIVSAADARLLRRGAWSLSVKHYAVNQNQYLHHAVKGSGKRWGHENGNGLDCRRSNLRRASHQQNAWNMKRMKDNTSGFKGVSRCRSRWQVKICGQHVGVFDTKIIAALAYDREARRRFGRFARLNFPEAT